MFIQTKPRPAGHPTSAIQFLGDPTVHRDIYLENEKNGIKKYCLRISDNLNGLALVNGCWIIGSGSSAAVIAPDTFERYWQIVK